MMVRWVLLLFLMCLWDEIKIKFMKICCPVLPQSKGVCVCFHKARECVCLTREEKRGREREGQRKLGREREEEEKASVGWGKPSVMAVNQEINK